MRQDDDYDKVVDLHVSEWKRKGRVRLPFTLFDVKIIAVWIIVALVMSFVAPAVVHPIFEWLHPSDWPPKWAREP